MVSTPVPIIVIKDMLLMLLIKHHTTKKRMGKWKYGSLRHEHLAVDQLHALITTQEGPIPIRWRLRGPHSRCGRYGKGK